MSSFISSSGLTYLWTKIKAWVNGQGFLTQHQDISGKADKSATVSTVTYDTTNKKIRKTINGITTDVVTAATIVTDGGGITTETDPTVPSWAKASSKPTYTASEVGALPDTTAIPTESTVSGWGFTKNAGTITGITMNGSSKGISGVVNLGTVITAHQDISGKADKATTLAGYGITDAYTKNETDGKYYALYSGTSISATSDSHADLNTYTDYGSYYCGSNSTADYVDNLPTTTTEAFRLWVSAAIGTGTTYIRQRFQYYAGTAIYERISTNGGSSWGNWYLVQANLANYASASDVTTLQGYFTNGVANSAATATSATTASNLSTVSKTAWGQTYWTSEGIPATISGNMTDVGTISARGNITVTKTTTVAAKVIVTNSNGGVSIYTSNNRGLYDENNAGWILATNGTNTWLPQGNIGIGTTSPTCKLDVSGNVAISGSLSLGGTPVVKVFSGSTAPSSSTGSDGDIYIQTS